MPRSMGTQIHHKGHEVLMFEVWQLQALWVCEHVLIFVRILWVLMRGLCLDGFSKTNRSWLQRGGLGF